MKKRIILKAAYFLSLLWHRIPSKIRIFFFTSFFIIESRGNKASEGLKRLFFIKDKLEWILNERAIQYGNGVHPKHSLTSYHNFFIERVKNGDRVLDIGCGIGSVAIDIATIHQKSLVTGVDINKENIEIAREFQRNNSLNNIVFKYGDINNQEGLEADVVILSNIIEHIKERKSFLKSIIKKTSAKKYLIRVPLFERDWQIPLRKKLGIVYFSDSDHKIEHTLEEFKNEILMSNLKIKEIFTAWGEIWANCENV